MKKIILTLITLALGGYLVACSIEKKNTNTQEVAERQSQKIVLGSVGSDAQIWKYIAQSEQAKQLGLNIEVKEINDGVALNTAVLDQEIDVNAFQSWAYFKEFNQLHQNQLVAIATTYLEPMGLYSKKYKNLQDLPQGAIVAIPNDVANTARALRLLEHANLITLSPEFKAGSGTVNQIVSNPKALNIKLVKAAQGPRVLSEVDLVAIGNTIALESDLNVIQDSLIHESVNDKVTENINVLVTHQQQKNNPQLQKLTLLYHQPFVKDYIQQKFGGTKLEINQPIASLNQPS